MRRPEILRRYLEKGSLYAQEEQSKIIALAIVISQGKNAELNNVVTAPQYRGKGYGSAKTDYLALMYPGRYGFIREKTLSLLMLGHLDIIMLINGLHSLPAF